MSTCCLTQRIVVLRINCLSFVWLNINICPLHVQYLISVVLIIGNIFYFTLPGCVCVCDFTHVCVCTEIYLSVLPRCSYIELEEHSGHCRQRQLYISISLSLSPSANALMYNIRNKKKKKIV